MDGQAVLSLSRTVLLSKWASEPPGGCEAWHRPSRCQRERQSGRAPSALHRLLTLAVSNLSIIFIQQTGVPGFIPGICEERLAPRCCCPAHRTVPQMLRSYDFVFRFQGLEQFELKLYTVELGTVLYYAGCNFTHATLRLVSQDQLGKSMFSTEWWE